MATGFTYPIYDNKQIEFSDFVLSCARAFFHDLDKLPDKFEPTDFHEKELKKDSKSLELVLKMSEEDCSIMANKEYEKAVAEREKSIKNTESLKNRYQAMLTKVEEWKIPTKGHARLKEFMIEQLKTSIDFDCHVYPEKPPVCLTGKQWKEQKIQQLKKSIQYSEERHKKEVDDIKKSNEWIQLLKQSLNETNKS